MTHGGLGCLRCAGIRPRGCLAAAAVLGAALWAGEPMGPPELKARGPEHNVTLAEEPGVMDLLAKAQKARAKAENDPEAWPECVKCYGDILRKFPNSVYLDRWEGPDKKDMAFKNGLYKSTRERVAKDIASLPPAGLAIYRVIADPPARVLFLEAQDDFDARKMEQVAQDYFPTSWGDQALVWLVEAASDGGAPRQGLMRIAQALKHPSLSIPKAGLLVRAALAQLELADCAGAEKTLREIETLTPPAKPGELRVGHAEGAAAIEKLQARLAEARKNPARTAAPAASDRAWPTYFGNAAHNRTAPPRRNVGLRKWSVPIAQLLYGSNAEAAAKQKMVATNYDGTPLQDPTMKCHLTVQDGYFYLSDDWIAAAYPVGNPQPGAPGAGGNAKFIYPVDAPAGAKPGAREQQIRRYPGQGGILHHAHFCTIGDDRLFVTRGAEAPAMENDMRWGGQEVKQVPNYIVALGKQATGGTLESGKLVWSLEPGGHGTAFESQGKADQEWLKSVFFVSAPTWEGGILYAQAVHTAGLHEAWVAAFEASSGRLLWRTQVCSANPVRVGGAVQPDLGLPVAVAGGTVYAVTNLGAVAALDTMTGGIKWIRIYDRMPSVDRFNNFGGGMVRAVTDFWGPNPPIVSENLLLVTPQDSELLYAYDIETGRRAWHISRTERDPGLKHVLGITNGNLVVTGTNVHFYEMKGGRETGPAEPLSFESPIKGRGVVSDNTVFVPTDRALICIDTTPVDGKFSPSVRAQHRWLEPEREAGHVFIAGDVLYTVSRTHVNAYFVWEEMEAKLKERIAQSPDDLNAYSELADVYQRVERFEQALAAIDAAHQIAAKVKDDPKTAIAVAELNRKKFDALMELGRSKQKTETATNAQDAAAAYASYKLALDVARLAGQPEVLPVMALRAMAENRGSAGDMPAALEHYQEIILRHGDAGYTYAGESSSKARLFACGRIESLKKGHPEWYAKIEDAAKGAFAKAENDVRQLDAVLTQYPNAETCGAVLLKLAQLNLDKNPGQARLHVERFLSRYPRTAEAPLATALLATACERAGLPALAKDALKRLATRAEFADKTMPFDPLLPPTGQDAKIAAAKWAAARLALPQFQRAISTATMSLGDGRLKLAWAKAAADQSTPLLMQGVAPEDMRRNLFYVENQTELSVLSSSDKGDELWLPRPKLPADCIPRPAINDPTRYTQVAPCPVGLWADRLLIVGGRREVRAYDSRERGKEVWKRELKIASAPPLLMSLQISGGRLVLAYPTGMLSVWDAMSGDELWSQNEGPFFGAPALGEGYVAVAVQNPPRIVVFDLDTGARRCVIEVSGPLATDTVNRPVVPVAQGDRVYFAERNMRLKAADAVTGKLLWQDEMGGAITALRATPELVVVAINGRQVLALGADGPGVGKKWSPVLPGDAAVTGLYVDGDDLYVTMQAPQQKPKLLAASISAGGKIQWDVEPASDPINGLPLSVQTVTTGHLVAVQSTWDPTGDKPTAVTLVDRRTGKTTWACDLSSDQRPRDPDGLLQPAFRVQVIEGGVVITEGHKRAVYLAHDARTVEETIATLADKVAKNPNDLPVRGRLAAKRFEQGDREKALQELGALLADAQLKDDAFVPLYADFSRLRQDQARKEKRTVVFTKVADGAALDATPATWAAVPETVFAGWRDVYLPSDDETSGAIKKTAWTGPDDLKVSFRGAYDDKNLHLLFVVTDDKHKNDATDANCCELGDSVRLFFDMDCDGGAGYRGEDFSVGAGLNQQGSVLAWRWVEHGKYLAGATPLEPAPAVVRKEAEKQTVYKFTLPLDYLKLKPEAGKKFGFSFAVNDQDDGDAVAKSICPSPGATGPANPDLFAVGVLEEKK